MALVGLIGGSGLDRWGEPLRSVTTNTPFGPPSGPVQVFAAWGHELLFLPRHGPDHAIAPHRVNYRANIHALFEHGAGAVVAINAVGGVDPGLAPGAIVVPDQLIDYTWGREHSFRDGEAGPLDHVEFAAPFDDDWRTRLLAAGKSAGVALTDGGCLGVTQGPRLETAAEVRRLARDGCTLVGMTTMPEAALAREAGLPYACLAVVANLGAGLDAEPISLEAIHQVLDEAMDRVRRVLDALFAAL